MRAGTVGFAVVTGDHVRASDGSGGNGGVMATGDILFLLLFIVLPTAVIVSGIWAIVFVRMRPPAARGAESEQSDEVSEPIALAAPAIDETVTIAAIAAHAAEPNVVGPPLDAIAQPQLSEREAIANVDPVAADLLFDQPPPPVRHYVPAVDRAPTEEMPAVVRDRATESEADSSASVPREDSGAAESLPLDPDVRDTASVEGPIDSPASDDDVIVLGPGGTDNLDPERAGVEPLESTADHLDPADEVQLPNAATTDPPAEPFEDAAERAHADEDLPDVDEHEETEAGAAPSDAASAQQQRRRAAPTRLIPAEDADPRERRRARNTGRRAPQLPRSVRRNERGMES